MMMELIINVNNVIILGLNLLKSIRMKSSHKTNNENACNPAD